MHSKLIRLLCRLGYPALLLHGRYVVRQSIHSPACPQGGVGRTLVHLCRERGLTVGMEGRKHRDQVEVTGV